MIAFFASCLVSAAAQSAKRSGDRIAIAAAAVPQLGDALDLGPVPASERIAVVLTLTGDPQRAQALGVFLRELSDAGSPEYRQWLTPAQFRARFGAPPEQLRAVEGWAAIEGLAVDAVSPGGLRLRVSGSASQMERSFAVPIDRLELGADSFYSNRTQPSVPRAIGGLIASVSGLDDLPSSFPAMLLTEAADGAAVRTPLDFAAVAERIDGNADNVLAIDFGACAAGSSSDAMAAAWASLSRQASAEGITLLVADRGCTGTIGSAAGSLAEVTSVVSPDAAGAVRSPEDVPRPAWQAAPGLPADALRHAPDLAAGSLPALAETLARIGQGTGGRLGNINPVLYQLAPLPGLFTQSDAAPAGTWEAATGLGLIDLQTLTKAFPRGIAGTTVGFSTNAPTEIHGGNVALTANVNPAVSGGPTPTGTIAFSTAGATLGGAPLFGGSASLFTNRLNAGTYSLIASYSGDVNYAPATSATLSETVLPEPGVLSAAATGVTLVGGKIAVTAKVGSGSGVGTPTGTVTVTQTGQTGTPVPYTGTLAGSGAVASTTINVPATMAGHLTFQAVCSGDANFTCNAPITFTADVTRSASQGSTTVLTISNATPTHGATVTLTATVAPPSSGAVPSGTVAFSSGATGPLGQEPLVNGVATLTTNQLLGGASNLLATYSGDSAYLNSVSVPVAVTVAPEPVQLTAVLPPSAAFGATIPITVHIVAASGVGVPTGVVTVQPQGAGYAGSVTGSLTGGVGSTGSAVLNLQAAAAGTVTLVGSYAGDRNFAATGPASATLVVGRGSSQTGLSLTPTQPVAGQPVTLTATVSTLGAIAPTGSVQFKDGTATLRSGGLDPTGTALLTVTLSAGGHALQAAYAGDSNYEPSSSVVMRTSGGLVSTSTASTSSANAAIAGQSVTLTTVVTPASLIDSAPPTGTVQVLDGAVSLGSGVLAGGSATLTVTLTGARTHSLITLYSGDTSYATSTSLPLTITVASGASTTTLSASTYAISSGGAVTLSATVAPMAGSGPTPGGSVTFSTSAGTLGTVPVVGGVASYTLSSLAPGTYNLSAAYTGDTNYTASLAVAPKPLIVSAGSVTLSATLTPAGAIPAGSTATLTASVTVPAGSTIPAETITVTIPGVAGAVFTGTVAAGGTGTVAIPFTAPAAGTYGLQIACSGNASAPCGAITVPLQTVAPGKIATTTSLGANPLSPAAGQTVTLTAVVTPASAGASMLSGTISFFDGTSPLATAPVVNGTASAGVTLSGPAIHTLSASYTGDSLYAGSSSGALTVGPAGSTTGPLLLSANLTSGLVGLDVVLTAQMRAMTGAGVGATGSISFFVATNPVPHLLGTVPVSAGGVGLALAVLTTNGLPAGSNTIYAVYSGDTNFPSATSANLQISLTDYGLLFNPPSLTLVRGTTGTVNILVSSLNGFSGRVSFGCTPPPSMEISCSITPGILDGSGTAVLTIATTAAGVAVPAQSRAEGRPGRAAGLDRRPERELDPGLAGGTAALAALAFLLLPGRRGGGRRRHVPGLVSALLGIALAAGAIGCAGNNAFGTPNGGSPLGTTNVTINTAGFDGVDTVRHNFTYQVTVQ